MNVTKGLVSGLFFIVTGLVFLVTAVTSYDMGTAARMGPAYFPTLCSAVLIGIGVISIIAGRNEEDSRPGRIHLKPILFVGLSLAAFALLAQRFGFVISLAVAILIVSLARRDISLVARVVMIVSVTAFLVFLFRVLLEVPIPVWPAF